MDNTGDIVFIFIVLSILVTISVILLVTFNYFKKVNKILERIEKKIEETNRDR